MAGLSCGRRSGVPSCLQSPVSSARESKKTINNETKEQVMKKLLVQAVRDAAKCLSDRMAVIKERAMNACERGQELRFTWLMSKVDELSDELVAVCAAGSALGMSKAELRPSVEGGAA